MPVPELITFFRPFADDAEALVTEADASTDKTALHMLYDTSRFPQYADKIREIPRSTEQIEMFFLVTLCEALYNLYEPEKNLGSKQRVQAFFDEFLAEDAKFFKYNWTRSIVDDKGGGFLSTEELVTVLYDLRCAFTHEGVNTELQFAHYDGEDKYDAMCHITHQNGEETVYDVKATYEEFRAAFIRMGLRCVRVQLARQASGSDT